MKVKNAAVTGNRTQGINTSQSSIYTARVVLNASVVHQAAIMYVSEIGIYIILHQEIRYGTVGCMIIL